MSDMGALRRLLIKRSVRKGNFILASGKSSNIYIDARLTTMSPEGMALIGTLGLERILAAGWKPQSIGGLTLGADPIAFAISHASASTSSPLRAFTVRKEAKAHGTGNLIEGPYEPRDQVVIIEDVITTGKSALQAIDAVEASEGHVLGVLALVDRQDEGREAIRSRGYEVLALTTLAELTA